MNFDSYVDTVQRHLTVDLLHNPHRARVTLLGAHPHTGHSYAASEALFHWVAAGHGFKPRRVKYEMSVHWFLQHPDGRILDPTVKQFSEVPPYDKSCGCTFVTKTPSTRATELLKRIADAQRPRQAS